MKNQHADNGRDTAVEMTDRPLISVVIPAYNASDFIGECLDSLVGQTYRPLEIIVVDDRSQDQGATIALVERYARQHGIDHTDADALRPLTLQVVQNEINGGCGMARAYGLRFVRGKYVMFVDSDDLLRSDALEKMVTVAEARNADMVKCEFELLHPDGSVTCVRNDAPLVYRGHDTLMTLARNMMSPPPRLRRTDGPDGSSCGVLYSASLLADPEVFFPPVPHLLSEDFIFNFRCLRKVATLVHYPTTFYRYRSVSDSITHAPRTDRLERAVKAAEYYEATIRQLEPGDELSVMHARGFLIGSIISSCTIYLLSDATMREKRRWFHAQRHMPAFRTLYEEYPWRQLTLPRRMGFISLYKGRFAVMYAMLRGRQMATDAWNAFKGLGTLFGIKVSANRRFW